MQKFIENCKEAFPEFTIEVVINISSKVTSSKENIGRFLNSICKKVKDDDKLIIIIEYNTKTKILYEYHQNEDTALMFARGTIIYANIHLSLNIIKKTINKLSVKEKYNCNICMEETDRVNTCPICFFDTCCICEINQYIQLIKDNKLENFRYECPQCRTPHGSLTFFMLNNNLKINEERNMFDKTSLCLILMQMLEDYIDKKFIQYDYANKLRSEIINLSCE
jgi:hypothetical protein